MGSNGVAVAILGGLLSRDDSIVAASPRAWFDASSGERFRAPGSRDAGGGIGRGARARMPSQSGRIGVCD